MYCTKCCDSVASVYTILSLRPHILLFLILISRLTAIDGCKAWDGVRGGHSDPSSEFSTFDLTPIYVYGANGQRLNTTRIADGHCTLISIQLTTFNKTFRLDLRLNRFMFGDDYVEKSMSQSGEQYHAVNQIHHNCFYTGAVSDYPLSTAAVSTCHSIKGYFMVDGETYYIEPTTASLNITELHYVYRNSDSTLPVTTCGTVSDNLSFDASSMSHKYRDIRSMRWPQDKDGTTRVVELYVVIDKSEYLFSGADVQKMTARTKDIVNVISSLFQPLDIYFVLTGIEIWTDEDRISITTDSGATLSSFLAYRRTEINPKHSNDNAHLISHVWFAKGVAGLANVGTMCTYENSGGINSDLSTIASRVGTTMAHEIGHNFGMVHDNAVSDCPCEDPSGHCIMFQYGGGGVTATQWSQCSVATLKNSLSHGFDYCLHNFPTTYTSAACGNGIIDDGEQCDCGAAPLSECNNACCNATNCQLVGSAECATGRCCDIDSCQLLKQATNCRPAVGHCDLNEYCSGKDAFCPTDVYKRDGTNCTVDGAEAYCYKGQCRSLDSQCKLLWGSNSAVSNERCFRKFNMGGSSYGHCGLDWATKKYTACSTSDYMCGQLHCSPAIQLAYFAGGLQHVGVVSVYKIGKNTYYCNATIIDVGMQVPDPGMAPDGAKCGEGKMCLSHQCVDVASLTVPSCPNNCSNHGVCNNLGECDCEEGYGTPDCNNKGCGGSMHGGSPKYGCVNNVDNTHSKTRLAVGLCIFFLVILPLLVAAIFFGYRYRKQIQSAIFSSKHLSPRSTNDAETSTGAAVASGANNSSNNNNNNKTKWNARPARPAPQKPLQPTAPSAYTVDIVHNVGGSPTPSRNAPRPPPGKPSRPVGESPLPLDPHELQVHHVIPSATIPGVKPKVPPKRV